MPAEKMTRFGGVGNFQDKFSQGEVGGTFLCLRAAATLTVGQAVKIDGNGEAAVCTADTDGPFFVGIVIGGASLNGVALSSADVGKTAAIADQDVYVAVEGSLVWAKKAAGAGLTAGVLVECGAAGILTGLTAAVFGERVAIVHTTAAAGDVVVKVILTKS